MDRKKGAPESDERRRHTRVGLEAQVTWRGGRGEGVVTFDAENVSQGGILLRASAPLAPGSTLTLELSLPHGYVPLGPRVLVLRGEVIRADPDAAGHTSLAVSFLDLDDAVEEALAKYVRRKSILGRP